MKIKASFENLETGVEYIRSELEKLRVDKRSITQTTLAAEELLRVLVEHSDGQSDISVEISHHLGDVYVKACATGTPFTKNEILSVVGKDTAFDAEQKVTLQNMIRKVFGDTLSVNCTSGFNRGKIRVKKSPYRSLIILIAAMLFGMAAGLILKAASPDFATLASTNCFVPIYTMLLNALKAIVAPLVFCSIAASIATFDDIRSLGRIAAKVFGCYILTSLVAIGIGFMAYQLFPIGDTALQSAVTDAAESTISKAESSDITLLSTIVGIIPEDIITPFQDSDMLQIIFMAILTGIAVSMVGNETVVGKFLAGANEVMLKITGFIIKFLPLSVFCVMAKLMINMDLSSFQKVIVWIPVIYAGDIVMIAFYCLILLLFAKKNPLHFLKDFSPAMVTAFSTGSSNATMPVSMEVCRDKLNIPSKIYSFSIPFGATVNMDGNCITLVITAMFMMKTFGLPLTSNLIVSLVIAIMALSMGSPGVPGGNLVCIAIILPMVGVPAEAVSLVMGLYSLVGMMQAMTNVTGDAVVTTIVAHTEKE